MESKETDSLCKVLDSGFYIPGYSADVIEFPSSDTDESSSSDSDDKELCQDFHENHDLLKVLSSGFHIPGYSADVIDFPSSGTDEYSTSDSENEKQGQDLHKDLSLSDSENDEQSHDLYKILSSGFHIPGFTADVIDFPSSDTDQYSSSDSGNEEQGQDLHKDLSPNDSENEQQSHDLYNVLSSGFHIPGYSADVIDFPSSGTDDFFSNDSEYGEQGQDLHKDLSLSDSVNDDQSHDLYKVLSSGFHIPGYSADVIDFPSSGSDGKSSNDSDSEVQIQSSCSKSITDFPGEESEKYKHCSIADLGDVFPDTSWQDSSKTKIPPIPVRGADFRDISWRELGLEVASSESIRWEKYLYHSWRVFADADSLKTELLKTDADDDGISELESLRTESDFTDDQDKPPLDVYVVTLLPKKSQLKRPSEAALAFKAWKTKKKAQAAKFNKSSTGVPIPEAGAVFPSISQLVSQVNEIAMTFPVRIISESSYSARVRTKTVIESGEELQIKHDLQRYKGKGQGLETKKIKGKMLDDIKPKVIRLQRFGMLFGVSVLRDDKVVACDWLNDCLYVFSPEGHYITSHHLPDARDVAGTSDGGMVAVNDYTLYKLDKQGHELWNVEKSQLQKYKMHYILGVCVDSHGLIYTRLGDSVCVVDSEGQVLRHIEHKVPHSDSTYCGIAVQSWGDILLPDPDNNCVVVLSQSGEHKTTLGGPQPQKGGLSYPCGIAVDSTGNVAVTSHRGHTVTVYSPTGECISTWGGRGKEPGKFSYPTGIAFTQSGDIIVCDKGNKRIQIFQSPASQKPHQRQTSPELLLATDSPPHYSSPPEKPQKAHERQTTPVHQFIH